MTSDQYSTTANLNKRIAIHERYSVNKVDLWQWAWQHYPFHGSPTVLEFGCGTGKFWRSESAVLSPDSRIVLSDSSEAMLEEARRNLRDLAYDFSFQVGDIDNPSFADSSFDVVLAHFMLYYARNPASALERIRSILRPGGWFGLILPSRENLTQLYDLAQSIDASFPVNDRDMLALPAEDAEGLVNTCFDKVERYVFADSLRISDVLPLIDYLQSIPVFQSHTGGRSFYQRYALAAQEIIDREGYLRVSKQTLLFVCRTGQ